MIGGVIEHQTIRTTSGTTDTSDSPSAPQLLVPAQTAPSNPFEDPFNDNAAVQNDSPEATTDESSPRISQRPRDFVVSREHELAAPNGQVDPCEEQFKDYKRQDRDCQIAHCKLRNSPICAISLDLDPRREPGFDPSRDLLPYECMIGNELCAGRHWVLPTTFTWKASALCHKPLYFEQVQLERYGHSAGPIAEPILSAAHFFVNIATLPYQMGMYPPNECQYALGYYRPGSCAPWMIDPVPISLRGAVLQAGAVVGGIYALP